MAKPRGRCPVCGRWMQLKKDGTLRHHGGETSNQWPFGRAYECGGTGQEPAQKAN